MSFSEEFVRGISYRSHFDPAFRINEQATRVLSKTFYDTATKAMEEPFFSIRQTLCSLAQDYAGDTSVQPYAYQCLADSHTFLQACLTQKIVDPNYMTLTVGDVSFEGKRLFNADRRSIQHAVDTGISTKDQPLFHVWLTLVDMTVIDLTIKHHLHARQRILTPVSDEQWLNVWRSERRGQFDYHPVLIDDDFLQRLQKPIH